MFRKNGPLYRFVELGKVCSNAKFFFNEMHFSKPECRAGHVQILPKADRFTATALKTQMSLNCFSASGLAKASLHIFSIIVPLIILERIN